MPSFQCLECTIVTPLVAADHLPVILLLDGGRAAELDYGSAYQRVADTDGRLTHVRTLLPEAFDATGMSAVVIIDLFPVHVGEL